MSYGTISSPDTSLLRSAAMEGRRTTVMRSISSASSLLNCLTAGSMVLYSLYAPLFHKHLAFTQLKINAVFIAGEIGLYVTVPLLGYLCDTMGPRPISLLASILFASSYALAGEAFTDHSPLWTFLVTFFFIGTATSALYFSALTTSAKNFPGHRGLSIAIPATAFGLSSFWEAILAGSPLFSEELRSEDGRILSRELDVVKLFNSFALLLGFVGIIGALSLRVVPPKKIEGGKETEEGALLPPAEDSQITPDSSPISERGEWTEEQRPFFTEVSTYLLGLVLVILLGSAEMYINCLGTMLHTIRPSGEFPPSLDTGRHISLFALSNTISRLASGLISDYISSPNRTHPISRIPFLLFLALNHVTALFLLSYAPISWLLTWSPICSILVGVGYGGFFTLVPTAVSVIWGVSGFGRHWGFLNLTPVLGAIIFGFLHAWVHDLHAPPHPAVCEGRICWKDAISTAAWTGLMATVLLGCTWWWGWRKRGWIV